MANANGIEVGDVAEVQIGGWIAIPGFWSCGFIRAVGGHEAEAIVRVGLEADRGDEEDERITASVPVAHGARSRDFAVPT